ncbi:hypothetical protein Sste5346_000816 [Sporothrix stenoceras]|uniref:Heterokaryon incompatibility domain-containing protein n=1 Tax=Sporothrix stenoceras TaxID=5173 RepID=A0ABR3ZR06_9PEZI
MPIRLLHSRDFTFHEFPTRREPNVPKYAILSHTWGDDEVSFKKLQEIVRDGMIEPGTNLGDGLGKIVNCCRQAAADGYDYAWIDTCCIDKTDSSELSEAINSMFRWYKESEVCYAYLADVPADDDLVVPGSAFRKSAWFTRGWTLQELLAPDSVVFYSQDWTYLDTRDKLKWVIEEVTAIDEDVLEDGKYAWANVSVKMSWAARRQTTKPEDLAYSLIGLFDVNMPLLYGEGEKAFQRLQLEIIKETNDQTIFSWTGDGDPSGMFARSPADFVPAQDSARIISNLQNPEFSLTNRGLRIQLPLAETPIRNVYVAILNCFPAGNEAFNRISLAVFLYRRFEDQNDFVRIYNKQLPRCPAILPYRRVDQLSKPVMTDMYIRGVKLALFHMHRWTTFQLVSDGCRHDGDDRVMPKQPVVIGVDPGSHHFRSEGQTSGRPPIILARLDDDLGSTVFLYRNSAQQSFAICLTLWGPDTKFGIVAGVENDDMREIADKFLFGDWEQTVKRPGSQTLQVAFPSSSSSSSRAETIASVTLGVITYDPPNGAFVCEVNVATAGDNSDFWLEMMGPGVWPGWWDRYMDRLAGVDEKAQDFLSGSIFSRDNSSDIIA